MKVHLFEIPVYRLSEEAYSQQQNDYVKGYIENYNSKELLLQAITNRGDNEAKQKLNEASMLCKEFGGGWRYNEIIGYVRVFKYGNQILAEYWQTDSKRIVKSRKKLFTVKNRKLVPEITIANTDSSKGINEAIELCVSECSKELKRRHLDLEAYNFIFKHVNWAKTLKSV